MKTFARWTDSIVSLLRGKQDAAAASHAGHYAQAMIAVGHQQLRLF